MQEHRLVPLDREHFDELYEWTVAEEELDSYTCRPVSLPRSIEEYAGRLRIRLCSSGAYYVLMEKDLEKPLGKIEMFDFNPRNHSAELGYYLPPCNRGKGLGGIMLRLFIETAFMDDSYRLNKLYATTSSHNSASVRLLEKHGFVLEGRHREHYWIGEDRHDQLIYSMLKSEWLRTVPSE